MHPSNRREFLQRGLAAGAVVCASGGLQPATANTPGRARKLSFGLVTYLWGQDWKLPTLIANCEKAGVLGVELRTTHAHAVERTLDKRERGAVKKRFADSPVTLVGIGSNERFDDPDQAVLKRAIEATKEFIRLSHDVGGSGVKVKPNSFHKGVPHEKTISQIGDALNEVGAYGAGFGQEIRLEVHGQCAELPIMKKIMDVADHENVGVCWNSNAQDLHGAGLEANFNMVKDRLGATAHIRQLDRKDYPYTKLFELFAACNYTGWVLLEAGGAPQDRVAALARQQKLFDALVLQTEI